MMFDIAFDIGWKSVPIAMAGALAIWALRNAAARERSAVAGLTQAMLVGLPLLMAAIPAMTVERAPPLDPHAVLAPVALPSVSTAAAIPLDMPSPTHFVEAGGADTISPAALVISVYLLGLAILGGRLVAGYATLCSFTRRAREVADAHWRHALMLACEDLETGRTPRLVRMRGNFAPISFGLFRPVILIDAKTEARREDAHAILRHEMAHIVRHDFGIRLLSRVARALFWFNPLVWFVDRQLEIAQEQTADDLAVRGLGAIDYSQALLNVAGDRIGTGIANGVASTGLERRVADLLAGRTQRPVRRIALAVAGLAVVAVSAPVAALRFQTPAAPPIRSVAVPEPAIAPNDLVDPVTTPATPPSPPPAPAQPVAPPPMPETVALAPVPEIPEPPQPELTAWTDRTEAHVRRAEEQAERAAANAERDAKRAERDAERAERQVEREVRQAERVRQMIERSTKHTVHIEHAVRSATATAHMALSQAADGLERGAYDMERNADRMASEGRKLCEDEAHRQQVIADSAKDGRYLDHDALFAAGQGLIEGAAGMREGAAEMREAAAEMRTELM